MERKFSYLYSQLVKNENDLTGHIAYSLYKSSKIEYIEQFKRDNDGKTPSEEDLEAFHKSAATLIKGYQAQAEQLMTDFTDILLQETTAEIEGNQLETLKTIIAPLVPKPKSAWEGFGMAIIVKGAQTVILGLIIFLIIFASSAKNGFWTSVRNLIPESNEVDQHNISDSTNVNNTQIN